MTPIDLVELRKKAEAATPGPWEYHEPAMDDESEHPCMPVCMTADGQSPCGVFVSDDRMRVPLDMQTQNGTYIAAVSPSVLLALLDRIEAAEEALEEFIEAGVDDGCGGYTWADQRIADAMSIAREALSKAKGGSMSVFTSAVLQGLNAVCSLNGWLTNAHSEDVASWIGATVPLTQRHLYRLAKAGIITVKRGPGAVTGDDVMTIYVVVKYNHDGIEKVLGAFKTKKAADALIGPDKPHWLEAIKVELK